VACEHAKIRKRYVGSTESYEYCPTCTEVSGGEESAKKRVLVDAACAADVTERDEVDGVV
jgi:hypothetical protein